MIWAIVTIQKEGFHYWEDAPKEVAFLRNKHRHIFSITVYIQQQHNERDVEFFILKHWLEKNILPIDGPESCETIATRIKKQVEYFFINKRKIKVQVMEDGENGALIE